MRKESIFSIKGKNWTIPSNSIFLKVCLSEQLKDIRDTNYVTEFFWFCLKKALVHVFRRSVDRNPGPVIANSVKFC